MQSHLCETLSITVVFSYKMVLILNAKDISHMSWQGGTSVDKDIFDTSLLLMALAQARLQLDSWQDHN